MLMWWVIQAFVVATVVRAATNVQLDLVDGEAAGMGREIDPGWLPAGVILDFDPTGLVRTGLDASDDLAFLAILGANDRVRLLGLTLTYGNSILAHTRVNARHLIKLAGVKDEDVPTVSGADWSLPGDRDATNNTAAQFIINTVNSYPANTIVLVCLGPLTNIAAALRQEPTLASRLRAIVLSGGSREQPSAMGHWDLNLLMGDRGATRVVLEARVPRVLITREACRSAPMSSAVLEAVRQLCPGSAGCEYLAALQHASQRGAGGRGWMADAWETIFGNTDVADTQAWMATEAAASSAPGKDQKEDGLGAERGSGNRLRQKASRAAAAGGGLCDLIAASAFLAPYGFREWDVMRVEAGAWGLEWGVVRLGFSARQAQALLGSAGSAPVDDAGQGGGDERQRRADRLPAYMRPQVVDWRAEALRRKRAADAKASSGLGAEGAEEGRQELWPFLGPESLNGASLLEEGVVLVPSLPEMFVTTIGKSSSPAVPAPIVHALALAFRVPHAEPYNEMKGSYVDDGFLNPYLMGPVVFFVASVGCAVLTMALLCLRYGSSWGKLHKTRVKGKDA